MILLYPGSFDPIHNGHLDIIKRGSLIADRVLVGIAINQKKTPLLGIHTRCELVAEACGAIGLTNVNVVTYTQSTLEFARLTGATCLLRGLRSAGDLSSELAMAAIHRQEGLDTIFILADGAYIHLSSSAVKMAHAAGISIERMVPAVVAKAINQ